MTIKKVKFYKNKFFDLFADPDEIDKRLKIDQIQELIKTGEGHLDRSRANLTEKAACHIISKVKY